MVAGLFLLALVAPLPLPLHDEPFVLETSAEVTAVVTASCAGCDWGRRGYEAAVLEVRVDGRYTQHLFLTRGEEGAEYGVALGRLARGTHRLTVSVDPRLSARHARQAKVGGVAVTAALQGSADERILAHAPVLMARANTLGRFSDVPLLLWVETDDLGDGRTRLRYSVVFSNEDGGTPPDRLMATWGRLTDIEFVYDAVVDAAGQVLTARYQGPEHQVLDFAGASEGSHPLLHVVTDNNMVSDRGPITVRVAPAPIPFDLASVSREAVMDAHPWTYAVSAREVRREGRVSTRARPGSRKVPDPRLFLTLEACAATEDATVAFSAGVRARDLGIRWFDSDAGLPSLRIARRATEFPNGCFRGAVALPVGTRAEDVVALRLRAYTKRPGKDEPPLARGEGRVRLERVNTVFLMGSDDRPGPSLFAWRGDVPIAPEGPPFELRIRD